ncbi:PLP-dependent aminotransferase family protein [Nocardia sp. NPDC052566]|uniref:MocR-like pyridoxine biosynthesis transcription factor PdxR n=1 Tax=Nocardia sp. NPDC052566 TaxID=3364330 RepID=UPI0037C9E303
MPDSGTNSGPDLLLTLQPGNGIALRVQLETALRDGVRTGRLAAGQRLPASRVLAADLGVSRRLVVDAYTQLAAEGYLHTRTGSGTTVSLVEPSAAPPADPPAERRPPRWDLRPGTPDLAHFPRRAWRRAWLAALTAAANDDFGYPDTAGHPHLRTVLAAYLTRVRGVAATPETVLVCGGVTQGLDLLCHGMRRAGASTVALEDPGLPHRAPIIVRAGLRPRPIPVDADGLIVDALPERGIDAVLITPAHQFPTGAVLAPQRREALVAWAARTGAVIVEDDYDGEFRFDRRAIGSLQGRAPGSVVYLGSTSKTLGPGLRLGWLVGPAPLIEQLVVHKFLTDHGSATLEQLALAELIGNGGYDRHIRQSRARYKNTRAALETAIARHRLPLLLPGIPAGLQTMATLPDTCDADLFRDRAEAVGVAFDSVTRYQHTPHRTHSVVLGYGNIGTNGIDQAAGQLAELFATEFAG